MEIVDLFGDSGPKKEKPRKPGKSEIAWAGIPLKKSPEASSVELAAAWLRVQDNSPVPIVLYNSDDPSPAEHPLVSGLREAFDLVDRKQEKVPSQILVESRELADALHQSGLTGNIPIFIVEELAVLRREMERMVQRHHHDECTDEDCEECDEDCEHCEGAHEGPHVDYVLPLPGEDGISGGEIEGAFNAFVELFRLAPWKNMPDSIIWSFKPMEEAESREYWGYVIGMLGQEFGLVLHSSLSEVMQLRMAMEDFDPDEGPPKGFELPPSISVQFDAPEDFPPQMKKYYGTFALKVMKQKRWPVIIVMNRHHEDQNRRDIVNTLSMAAQAFCGVIKKLKKEKKPLGTGVMEETVEVELGARKLPVRVECHGDLYENDEE